MVQCLPGPSAFSAPKGTWIKGTLSTLPNFLTRTHSGPFKLSTKFLNMFSKLSLVFTSVFVILVAAIPTTTPPVPSPTSPQCCSSVVSSTSEAASAVAALVGLDFTGIDVPVGLSCSPITVIGNNCGSTTVTCDAPDVEWGGLIAINCIPITA